MLGLSLSLSIGSQQQASSGGGSTTAWDTVNSNAGYTYTNSNKTATLASGTADRVVLSATGHTSGNYTATVTAPGTVIVGLGHSGESVTEFVGGGLSIGYASTGNIYNGGPAVQTGLATYTTGDAIKASFDGTNVQFFKNGVAVGTAVNVSASFTTAFPMCSSSATGAVFAADFTNWP